MTAIFTRYPTRRDRSDVPAFITDSFFERFGPDTAIVVKDCRGQYTATTFADIGREKRERQADILHRIRTFSCEESVRPMYVWVFWCPGIGGFAYRGWWTYLIWRGGDSGKYLDRDEKIVRQLMELFPMGEPTLFGSASTHRQWQVHFAKVFCCRNPDGTPRKHAGRIQGKALLWAEFNGAHLHRIIGRAYLTTGRKAGDGRSGNVSDNSLLKETEHEVV